MNNIEHDPAFEYAEADTRATIEGFQKIKEFMDEQTLADDIRRALGQGISATRALDIMREVIVGKVMAE